MAVTSFTSLAHLKLVFTFLFIFIILVTIWVLRTEHISMAQTHHAGDALEHPPSVVLVNDEMDHSVSSARMRMQSSPDHTNDVHDATINDTNGIQTAPYDLSKLYIYGEDKYCGNPHRHRFKFMDITGMYDTGTNAFYQVLTKNCWGLETRMIDYIQDYLPPEASDADKQALRARAQRLYAVQRPKVEQQVSEFENVKWKPLTGKHHAISAVQDFDDPDWKHMIGGIRDRLTLVIVKDPLTWFKSLCKASYEVHFHSRKFRARCPFGLSARDGKWSANMWHSAMFSSVVHLWNWWYGGWTDSGETISGNWKPTMQYFNDSIREQYNGNWRLWMSEHFLNTNRDIFLHDVDESRFDARTYYTSAEDIPHLVIRYEDILFQPEILIDRLCRCVGGYVRQGGVLIKEEAAKGHGVSRGRTQALQTYGNPNYRTNGYSEEDLRFIRNNLNQTLLTLLGYPL